MNNAEYFLYDTITTKQPTVVTSIFTTFNLTGNKPQQVTRRTATHPPPHQQVLHLTLSISRTSPLPQTSPPQPPTKTTQPKTMTSRMFTPLSPIRPHSLDLTVNLLFNRVIRSDSSLSLFRTVPLISRQLKP